MICFWDILYMYEGKLLSTLKEMSTFSSHINDRSYYEFN